MDNSIKLEVQKISSEPENFWNSVRFRVQVTYKYFVLFVELAKTYTDGLFTSLKRSAECYAWKLVVIL
jgi:hypothetical protein